MTGRARLICGIAAMAGLTAATPAAAQHGAPDSGEWRTYGGDLGSTKYSPLDQIDASNFADLEIAWRWQSADAFMSKTTASGGEWWAASDVIFEALNTEDPDRWRDGQPPSTNNLKATPLMVGGRLFESTGLFGASTIREVDRATGTVIRSAPIQETFFAEGMTALGDGRLVQLTWKAARPPATACCISCPRVRTRRTASPRLITPAQVSAVYSPRL